MKEKKGISLIVLIVTIIVMIIIAGAIILSLTETNIIDQAEVAVEKHNLSEMKSAASMAYSDWTLRENTTKDNTIDVQSYIRNSLINQGFITWEDTSKYYITRTGGIEEIEDQDAFIFVIDIPEDNCMYTITVNRGMYKIDWGDNSPIEESHAKKIYHTYEKKGEYEIKITGDVSSLLISETTYESEYLKEIKSFGNLNLKILLIFGGSNLKYLPNPNSESFAKLSEISLVVPAVQEIPDYFFKDCNALTYVDIDADITSLPLHLFDGVNNISSIVKNFPEGVEIPDSWN